MGGDYPETFLLPEFCYGTPPSCILSVCGGWPEWWPQYLWDYNWLFEFPVYKLKYKKIQRQYKSRNGTPATLLIVSCVGVEPKGFLE